MDSIADIIQNVGFPIVACIYMGYYQQKTIKALKDSIDQNTLIIKELKYYLESETIE